MLKKAQSGVPVALVKRLMHNIKKETVTTQKFPEELRSFAMTLQFYSSKAYDYVRRTFGLALPSPSVIRNWLTNVDCEPGFSASALDTLKSKVQEDASSNRKTICALIFDEMAIKKQIDFLNGKVWGYVDIGCGITNDNLNCATEALVLMVVSLNSHWKLPIAYYLIDSLTSAEKANVVQEALWKLNEVGVIITSVTCDGPTAHFSMAKKLGARFQDVHNIQPYFQHPSNKTVVYTIFDACHMLKLMRNNWAKLRQFLDGDCNIVDFKYVEKLAELQEEEGFRFGTKLRKAHMQWEKQKMKVNLAAQTLSNSVADAIEFLMVDVKHPFFKDAKPTIEFIRNIDRLFDLCNSRNPYGKGCKTALKESNVAYWRPILVKCLNYLKTLKNKSGTPLYMTKNKTPIKGFLITGLSLLGIYQDYVVGENTPLDYFLTYKVSQDHLELFFCSVRARNGWNNNPTAYQFFCSFRRLLLQHDLKRIEGNCTVQDGTSVLTVTKRKSDTTEPLSIDDISMLKKYNLEYSENESIDDHDYVIPTTLSFLTDNVVCYIAGFVVKSAKKRIKCQKCILALEQISIDSTDDNGFLLIARKNRGGLVKPSSDVVYICRQTEIFIKIVLAKSNNQVPGEKRFIDYFLNKVYTHLMLSGKCFLTLSEHLFDSEFCSAPYIENHVTKLIKMIVNIYVRIRFFNLAKKQTENVRGELVRKKFTKLVLFHHQ